MREATGAISGWEMIDSPSIEISAVLSPRMKKDKDQSNFGIARDFANSHARTAAVTNDTAAVRPKII